MWHLTFNYHLILFIIIAGFLVKGAIRVMMKERESAKQVALLEERYETSVDREQEVNTAENELAGVQNQIQAIIDKRDANNLILERQAGAGQVTGQILGRQQQEINRQAAIDALPLQAKALAAQARVASAQGKARYAQSVLKAAQDKLDNAFRLKAEDIKNAYDFAKDNRTAIYDFLTNEQKTRADVNQKKEDRQYQITQDRINDQQSLSQKFMSNWQADLAVEVTQLNPSDKDYINKLAKIQGKYVEKVKPITGTLGGVSSLTNSIIENPSLFDDLTPTAKGGVIAQLQAQGYDTVNLGVKGLSDTAIKELAQTHLLVNATKVGLSLKDTLLVPKEIFPKKKILVYDLIYKPCMTALLRCAKSRGHQILNGENMLLYQGAKAFEIWTGEKAPIQVMRKALRHALSAG